MEIPTQYNPSETEDKWYKHWMEKEYFRSIPDEREPYTIVIPPPNVTGVLHMGHMLNNTIQDVLIRKARLEGKNACWVPGTDHASIATENKVIAKLRKEKGIRKSDLTREEFLEHAWAWKEEYGGIILEQLKRLGASCDWERTRFTMEEGLSKAVSKVFIDLYKKGRIYRGLRICNWDPDVQTVLSNEEVIFAEEASKLYHVRYRIEGTDDEWVTIATTRPETILGDTGIAVNPSDERYAHLKGKKAIVPMVERPVPIIFDRYVDMEFGTGCLKVTPAHDANDYEIGKRHHLETIDTFNADGTMSEAAQFFIGQDRFEVRKLMEKELQERGHLVKIEDYTNKVGRSERSKAVVEPRLMLQWWVKMDEFAKMALDAVKDGEVDFYPSHFFNMYNSWLQEDNIRDWCISRQLWWGHRIPAWYLGEEVFVAGTKEEALEQAKEKTGNSGLTLDDLKQDEDALDTWFSSWLWPISVFDGFENQEELKYYYPTNVLVTGWDIMFFWVARMIMAGYEWSEDLLGKGTKPKYPFKSTYFTGMVRDKFGLKMSKSLGNSPNALKLLDEYGADGVRYGMLSSAAAGNDIIFDAPPKDDSIEAKMKDPNFRRKAKEGKIKLEVEDESEKCNQGRKFSNKIWNGMRLVKSWDVVDEPIDESSILVNTLAAEWFENLMNLELEKLEKSYSQYRLSEGLNNLYNFIWGDFCSWYLEMVKPPYQKGIDRKSYEKTIYFFEKLMTVLHPFMPFITEEIWHYLKERNDGDDCVISQYPPYSDYDKNIISDFNSLKDIVAKIREQRTKNGLKKYEPLQLFIQESDSAKKLLSRKGLKETLLKTGVLSEINFTDSTPENGVAFISGTDTYFIIIEKQIDVAAELEKATSDLEYQKGFLEKINKKLGNAGFVNGAPEKVVAMERKKQSDATEKIKQLEELINRLKS